MTAPETPGSPNLVDREAPRRRRFFTLAAVGLAVAFGWGLRRLQVHPDANAGPGGAPLAASDAGSLIRGRGEILFQVHCAKCHGPEGRGDPESIARLRPPPRDFAERPWRFAISAESIRQVIADGIPGTAMAANRMALSASEIDQLVDHVLALTKRLPIVERALTPGERRFVSLGFDIERQPFPTPVLTLEDAQGTTLSLAQLRGSWVVVDFWGISCAECRAAMPALRRFSEGWSGEKVQVLAVCTDADDARSAQELLAERAPGLTAYLDATGIGIARFGVQALPMICLIDPHGRVCATRVGAINWDSEDVRGAFVTMLAERGAR